MISKENGNNQQPRKCLAKNNSMLASKLPFPFILHEMLNEVTQVASNETIVSWQPHGKAFRVHKPIEFIGKIMPCYFKQKHYKSFQRQLNLYGFRRIRNGLDKGAYYHKLFIREKIHLCFQMTRCRIKGPEAKKQEQEMEDPNFYAKFRDQHEGIEDVGSHDAIKRLCSRDISISHFTTQQLESAETETLAIIEQRVDNFLDVDEAFFAGRRFFMVENTDTASHMLVRSRPTVAAARGA